MTKVAGGEENIEWGLGDQIHLELYARLHDLQRLAEHNALVWFANDLMADHVDDVVHLTDEEDITLDDFLDIAIQADRIVRKHLGQNYIADYLATLDETEETE
jgi:hypothetical protein